MNQQERIQQRIKELQQAWGDLTELITSVRQELALTLGGQQKVILEKRLEKLERERTDTEARLNQLEQEELELGPSPISAQASGKDAVSTDIRGNAQIAKKIYHNLPQPDYGRFIGRKAELKQIRQLLLPYPQSRFHIVTIDGVGGVGKSALALETASGYLRYDDQLSAEERFAAIIWTTAKQTVLTGEGIRPRHQSLRTLDDIYTTIAITLEREDITRVRLEEQDELVRQALARQRTLLIVDNLETVDDERVISFIRDVPDPTKVIVTTRHRLDVAYPVRVVGMSETDALTLIADEAQKKGVTLTDDEARRLYRRTGGVPLAIVWSVAQMSFGYGVQTVLTHLGQPASDIAQFCFEGAMECIRGKPAHKLLMTLSFFVTNANREVLGYVADLPMLDRDEGLVTLEKLSLVNKYQHQYILLPLTRAFALAELNNASDFRKQAGQRWVNHLKAAFDDTTPTDIQDSSPRKSLSILEQITIHLPEIKQVLGNRWPVFTRQIQAQAPLFENLTTGAVLDQAANQLLALFVADDAVVDVMTRPVSDETRRTRLPSNIRHYLDQQEPAIKVDLETVANRFIEICRDPDKAAELV